MTTNISEIVARLRDRESFVIQGPAYLIRTAHQAADAFEEQNKEIEDLKHDNANLLKSVTGEAAEVDRLTDALESAMQELRNIANADTVEWDDPSQYEAWAKSRARHTLAALSQSTEQDKL